MGETSVVEETIDEMPPDLAANGSATGLVDTEEAPAGGRRFKPQVAKPRVTTPAAPAEPALTPSERAMARAADQPVFDWLQSLGAGDNFKIQVHRLEPTSFKNKKVGGYLHAYSHLITDEEIRENHGGGKFNLRVMRPNPKTGSLNFFKATTIEIAGDPRTDNLPNVDATKADAAPDASSNPMLQMVMTTMKEDKNAAIARADKIERESQNAGGNLMAMIATALKPMELQVAAQTAQLAAKDRQIADLMNELRAPKTSMQDTFVESMLTKGDVRLSELRAQFDSELRVLKENHRDDLKRLEDRAQRDRDDIMRAHEREFGTMKETHARELATMKSSFERELANSKQLTDITLITKDSASKTENAVLAREVARLEKEIDAAKTELKELRAKKDQTLKEKVDEIQGLKNLFEGDEEEKEKGTLEKIVEVAVGSDKLMSLADKWMAGKPDPSVPQAQAQAQQALVRQRQVQQRRSGKVVNKATGQVGQRNADGSVTPVMQENPDGTKEPLIALDEQQVAEAVAMLEQAFRGGVEPQNVATTARIVVPEPIMNAIRREGMDGFLTRVVQLEASSPLATQAGRNWIRKVGKALGLGDDAP